jgi:hypothetical protein
MSRISRWHPRLQTGVFSRSGKTKHCSSTFANRICKPRSSSAHQAPDSSGKSFGSAGAKSALRTKNLTMPCSWQLSCSRSSRQIVTRAFRREIAKHELEPITDSFLSWRSQLEKRFKASALGISVIDAPLPVRIARALAILAGETAGFSLGFPHPTRGRSFRTIDLVTTGLRN